MNAKITLKGLAITSAAMLAFASCKKKDGETYVNDQIKFENKSATPVFLKKLAGFEGVETYSLLGSDDKLANTPNFVFGGSADGAGFLSNPDGTYTALINHEDNFAVSRITLNKELTPVAGEYILNSNGGVWRLCSATMATPNEHGFGPVFLTCGESGEESRTHAINPLETNYQRNVSKEVPALGRWSAENAMPLNKSAFPGKTVIIIGDDDSGTEGGQVVMYVADGVGNLTSGEIYVMKRPTNNTKERDMVVGTQYDVEFVKINNARSLTGRQIQLATVAQNAIKFGRVEDIDYKKGGSAEATREIYFAVTGQNNSGANADYARTKFGRIYKMNLNAENPLVGKLEVILDGDDRNGIAKEFQNPDNICVTENYAYIQEDPNSYGTETHDSYIYQYNLATKEMKKVFELDHRRTASDAAKYNIGGASTFGSWEYGALIDISYEVNVPNTFMLCIQPHTWRGDKYKGVDGGSLRLSENQASQLVILRGLPK